ncbi:lasso RiPP family leader peptide-containing protein [Streptomyces iconiensis]|uniref:Lasso RiPP family leader peptide-containing protein n=1 Tax=Streptomyces iconiensis TaxID=1384038 RepID=A0ABT7A0A7_9ACTN|nr:lasso RiPP family leader peptide-containing protein [Streptomyces iconiensis]MDJ1134768.1 lasso RiPP family leader peptide-containing protein [Streptomyces iconiensis]
MEQHQIEPEVETGVYEPPAMVEAGDFAEVTLGPMRGLPLDSMGRFRHW